MVFPETQMVVKEISERILENISSLEELRMRNTKNFKSMKKLKKIFFLLSKTTDVVNYNYEILGLLTHVKEIKIVNSNTFLKKKLKNLERVIQILY